jgi:HAD superfamily hydrolase (TIGR01509 family)
MRRPLNLEMTMKLELPPGPFDAYLFDCDGTIADSMPLHFEAWNHALSEWGGQLTEELFYAWAGIPFAKTIDLLNEKYGLKIPLEPTGTRKEEHYHKLLSKIQPVESVVHHVREQHGKIPFAVVSGSPRDSILKTLKALELLDYFPIIVGAEDYSRGKPHPDPFLLAAKLLGAKPERCLVFEDADLGIESARAAGMSWVKVPIVSQIEARAAAVRNIKRW